jgi:hypothetical protein
MRRSAHLNLSIHPARAIARRLPPWSGMRRYRRVQQEMVEDICTENNQHLFDYHIPVASQPDF